MRFIDDFMRLNSSRGLLHAPADAICLWCSDRRPRASVAVLCEALPAARDDTRQKRRCCAGRASAGHAPADMRCSGQYTAKPGHTLPLRSTELVAEHHQHVEHAYRPGWGRDQMPQTGPQTSTRKKSLCSSDEKRKSWWIPAGRCSRRAGRSQPPQYLHVILQARNGSK
jgi:hypothetical protein